MMKAVYTTVFCMFLSRLTALQRSMTAALSLLLLWEPGITLGETTEVDPHILSRCPRCNLFKNAMRQVNEEGICTDLCLFSARRGFVRGFQCGRCRDALPPASSPVLPPVSPPISVPDVPTAPFPPPSPTSEPPPVITPPSSCSIRGYGISLDLANADQSYHSYFSSGAERWSTVVKGDLPRVNTQGINTRCNSLPAFVDGLHICARTRDIDGAGGVLGFAGVEWSRTGTRTFPAIGFTTLDSSDIPRLISNGSFQSIIVHEFGHLLGLGTVWGSNGLTNGCMYRPDTRASAEFQSISGCPSSTPVPLETGGGSGTNCGHWQEACLRGELMTGFASPGFELSRITIGSLEDIGYQVCYDAADAFNSQNLGSCQCNRRLVPSESGQNSLRSTQSEGTHHGRILSRESRDAAVKFGKNLLKEGMLERRVDVPGLEYFGDKVIVVYYWEGSQIHDVFVLNS